LDIYELPKTLVITLNRFKTHCLAAGGLHVLEAKSKLDVLVDFPLDGLDLNAVPIANRQVQSRKYVYSLVSLCNHYGHLLKGHYTAVARNFANNKWFEFNDEHVSQIEDSAVVSEAAYILIYQQVPSRGGVLGRLQ